MEELGGKPKDNSAAAGAVVLTQALQSTEHIFVELLRASLSNPLMGVVSGFVTVAVFRKAGILTDQEATNVKLVLLIAAGVSITEEIIKAVATGATLASLGINVGGSSDSLLKPSGQVFVFGQNSENPELKTLLQTLVKKP